MSKYAETKAAIRHRRISNQIESRLVLKSGMPPGVVKSIHEYNKVFETPALDGHVSALAEIKRLKRDWLTKSHWTDSRVCGNLGDVIITGDAKLV